MRKREEKKKKLMEILNNLTYCAERHNISLGRHTLSLHSKLHTVCYALISYVKETVS